MADYRIISSDNHIVEPPDLWLDRISPKFKDRAPRVGKGPDGRDAWVVDNVNIGSTSFAQGTHTGARFDDPERMKSTMSVFGDVRPGAYLPDEAIKDMDLDGIDVGILYATEGLLWYSWIPDSRLLSAIFSAYNDFCAEFCTANPKRLKGIAFLNVDDVQDAVRELERCAKMGMIGVAIPVFNERMRYDMPEFDPLWAAAEANEMPISLHISTNRPSENNAELGRELFRTIGDVTNASDKTQPLFLQYLLVNGDYWARQSLGDMILSGVFERFPKLHVGAVETEMAWAVHWLRMIDLHYTDTPPGNMGYRFKNEMLPSDFFRRNCFIDTQEDFQGIKLRDQIGVDNILWGNDYPHMESTFPKSMEFLSEMLKDCTEEEKEKISGGNAARIYRI